MTSSIHKKQKSRSDTRLVSVLLVTFSMSAKAQIRYASKQTEHCLASRISLASALQQSLHKQISARTCVLPWYSDLYRSLRGIQSITIFLLFKLNTPVNNYGNVGTASSLNHTFSQHKLTSTSRLDGLDQALYKENKKDNCYMTSIFTLIPGTVKYAFLPLREIIFVNNTYGALLRPKLPD